MLSIEEKLKFCEKMQEKVYWITGVSLPADEFLRALEYFEKSAKILSVQLMVLAKSKRRLKGTKSNPLRFNDVARRIKK